MGMPRAVAAVALAQKVEREAGQALPDTAADLIRRSGKRLRGRTLIRLGYDIEAELAHVADPIVCTSNEKRMESRRYAPASWLKPGGGG